MLEIKRRISRSRPVEEWKKFLEIRCRHFQKELRKYMSYIIVYSAFKTIGMWAIYDEEESDLYNWKGCASFIPYNLFSLFFFFAIWFVYSFFNIKTWVEFCNEEMYISLEYSREYNCLIYVFMRFWLFEMPRRWAAGSCQVETHVPSFWSYGI